MIRLSLLILSLLVLSACASPTRPDPAAATAEVIAAERAFARSMADRDLATFASHVDEEAVFFNGSTALRGKDAVVQGWKAFFDGEQAPFSWQPEQVEVLASGDLALSSGPVIGPDGKQLASFQSVWRRQPSGIWKVVFDRGCHCAHP